MPLARRQDHPLHSRVETNQSSVENGLLQRQQRFWWLSKIMKTDVLIIGGGPGSAATAMFLVRQGIKPIILEQEAFPRYHIGESLTG
jgi:ribulose 1,5-bisphosphate synthetase/thiazole synthase